MSHVMRAATALAVALAGVSLFWMPVESVGQGKTRIAVTAFENKMKGPVPNPSWRIGEGLAEMLTTELMETGRFTVVERVGLGDVIQEQQLGQSGLVRSDTAAKTGRLMGAQIVVRGAVTEFEMRQSGGGFGVGTKDFKLGGSATNAHVALDIRLIDTSSGQVLASHRAAKIVPAGGGGFGARVDGVQFGADAFYRTPIGKATRAAIHDCVRFIVANTPLEMASSTPSFAVVKVSGAKAYINAGADTRIRVGDVFAVFSKGEELIDPDTGLKLGSEEEMVGSIRITAVREKFSVGTILSGSGTVKRGDRVRRQ